MFAMKVMVDPAHIGLVPETIEMEHVGETTGFTVIVIPLLVAVAGLGHAADEVNMHVTTSPVIREELV
jgi:hypothetical protein